MKIKERHLLTLRDALHLLNAFSNGDPNTVFGGPEEIAYDTTDEWKKHCKEMINQVNESIIKLNEK